MSDDVRDLARTLRDRAEGHVNEFFPQVYAELQRVARARLRSERPDHTLQATALVHEVFLRLGADRKGWSSRRQFYGAASEAMRRVLVDHARRSLAVRRGGGWLRVTLPDTDVGLDLGPEQLLELDDAIARLEARDARAAEVARLRLFAGLELEEVAVALGVSRSTVTREWKYARARLRQLFGEGEEGT